MASVYAYSYYQLDTSSDATKTYVISSSNAGSTGYFSQPFFSQSDGTLVTISQPDIPWYLIGYGTPIASYNVYLGSFPWSLTPVLSVYDVSIDFPFGGNSFKVDWPSVLSGNDTIYGNTGWDRLFGYGGDDQLKGGGGNDLIDGGSGTDKAIYSGSINDYTITETLTGYMVTDNVGSDGQDTLLSIESLQFADQTIALNVINAIHGTNKNDTLTGTDANDAIFGYDGNDKLFGLGGNDYLDGGSGNNTLNGGDGDNVIVAGDGKNKIIAGSGADQVTTGLGNDNINVGDGNNIIDAGAGKNKVVTGLGSDTITAGAGNDNITAGAGNNHVDAGSGNNKITSLEGSDTIATGSGKDNINAGDGNNTVETGAGNDKVIAGAGNDIINGGDGTDKLTGGAGSDHFVFDNLAAGGSDTINDYLTLEDVLVFDSSAFTSLAGGITPDNVVIGAGSSAVAHDSNDFLILNAGNGKFYYDADGNGAGAALQIATLKGVTLLDVSHLIIEA